MTTEFYLPGRNHRFVFYETGAGVGSEVVTGFTLSHPFCLEEVRVVFSGSFASTEDLVLRLSCGLDSLHNATFFSQSNQGYSTYFWAPSAPLWLLSDDHLIFSVVTSDTGSWGIFARGWAVVEP